MLNSDNGFAHISPETAAGVAFVLSLNPSRKRIKHTEKKKKKLKEPTKKFNFVYEGTYLNCIL